MLSVTSFWNAAFVFIIFMKERGFQLQRYRIIICLLFPVIVNAWSNNLKKIWWAHLIGVLFQIRRPSIKWIARSIRFWKQVLSCFNVSSAWICYSNYNYIFFANENTMVKMNVGICMVLIHFYCFLHFILTNKHSDQNHAVNTTERVKRF